ncbi:MAG TPA: class I SAM-dependent methyltransferase [Streptosporangiales bacterium]
MGTIRTLPRVIPAEPGKPARPGTSTTQRHARAIAEDPASWSATAAADVVRTYAELAPVWDDERGGYRPAPLADALDRGGPFPPGDCLEIGSGTGLLTPLLARHWERVMCLDLSWDMLRRSPSAVRVLADASRLPVADGRAAAVVLADAPLFAEEVVRVLSPDGVVVWSNALGPDAPNYVPVAVVRSALERASGGSRWSAVTADAGWGRWAVLRLGNPLQV